MAELTASVSGLASAAATWGGAGTPAGAGGDTLHSNADVLVEWDLDHTAVTHTFTTWDGTLYVRDATGAGTYGFGLAADMAGSGSIILSSDGTTSGGVLAFAVKFLIALATFKIPNTIAKYIRCFEPTHKWVYLKNQEIATATVLETDDEAGTPIDLTAGDDGTAWDVVGNKVRVDDINKGKDTEERTIASIDGTSVTTDALVAQKEVGAIIALVTRNIRITTTGTTIGIITLKAGDRLDAECAAGGAGRFLAGTGATVGGVIHGFGYGLYGITSSTINGVVLNCGSSGGRDTDACYYTSSSLISGCVSGLSVGVMPGVLIQGRISGCTTAIAGTAGTVLGTSSVIKGCTTGLSACASFSAAGTIANCTTGIYGSSGVLRALMLNNTADIDQQGATITGYGSTLGGTTQVSGIVVSQTGSEQVVIYDIGTVAGALKAWMPGVTGYVFDDDAGGTLPAGSSLDTTFYKFPCASATLPAFLDFPIVAPKDVEITISGEVYLSAEGMTERPTLQLVDPSDDPIRGGTAVIDEDIAADSSLEWQSLSLTYTATYQRPLIVRVRARDSVTAWWGGVMVTQAGGGGGAVGRGFSRGMA